MTPKPGHCPPAARGKRVRVRLRNGSTFEAPADGARGGVNWALPHNDVKAPFAVAEWELAS